MNKNQSSQIIIYNTEDGKSQVNLYARDGNIWLNQKQITELFDTSLPNINMHISAILKEKELEQNSVVKNYFTTAIDGKNYNVAHYNLKLSAEDSLKSNVMSSKPFHSHALRESRIATLLAMR